MKRLHESPSIWNAITRVSAGSLFLFALTFAATNVIKAQSFTEGFDTVTSNTATPLPNWTAVNNSAPVGTTGWFQGNIAVFPAQAGAATNSYIGANFNNTTGSGNISNWLIAPVRTFKNGDTISFYTRTGVGSAFPDRLQLRLSTAGASTNVGATDTSVGDFTVLLLDINPTLAAGGYPEAWTQSTATISGLAGPTSGRFAFRYFVTNGGPSGANSNYIGIDTLAYTAASGIPIKSPLDFNGDGKTDWSVVRNTGGGTGGQVTWFNCYNGIAEPGCYQFLQFGISTDFFVPADYDGDGKADIAVWRPGTQANFFILQSGTNTVRIDPFGQTGDNPTVVADYTGDGKADPAVYRPGASAGAQSFFYYRASSGVFSGGTVYEPWGLNGDFPAPGDFDGDGKADFMVQRNGGSGQAIFFLRTNTTNVVSNFRFGTPTDLIVPGDYDGDGKTDIAVVRGISGNIAWFVRKSSAPPAPSETGYVTTFGLSASDFPTPGDYDGDGKSDIAVWRPNADPTQCFFFVLGSNTGSLITKEWGQNGDYPVANYNTH